MSSSTRLNIAFLFGSGISIPVGMPHLYEITERILSGKGIMRHTDGNYYFGDSLYAHVGVPDEYVPRVVTFLNRVKTEIDLYYVYQTARSTNYEDLYYVATQISDSESGEYDNPAVQPFIDKILPEVKPLLVGRKGEIRRKWQLHELAIESARYIKDIVWHMLSQKPSSLEQLDCIKDACLDNQGHIDIFTLNHDTVLEQCLSQNERIQLVDGFGDPQNNVRYWQPELFDSTSTKVRLFKLHGSVNWFLFRPDEGSWDNEAIGIPMEWDIWHTKSPKGQRQWPIDGRPMFLAGTFNKLFNYTSSIYAELHCHFHNALKKNDQIVICGYGFGDKGINTRIFEWIHEAPTNRIILIHHKEEELKKKARKVLVTNWDDLKKHNRLIVIPKTIEYTSWQDIKDYILQVAK
jgi:hypothetical protein